MDGWKRVAIWLLRLAVGGFFILSGFVKLVDLWGFVFKLEEYLAVWGIVQPRTIVLVAALMISGYEFVLGALLAMGCYKRCAPWGLGLMMAVMLPLTLYLWIADPVSDCGCFGDFWKLSNGATFFKNVVISAGLSVLLVWNCRLKESLFNPAIQWMVGAWISLYALVVGLYGYNVQPVVDFRSYPIGTVLAGAHDEAGDAGYRFVYEKDGATREFDLENLPDSTWTFVDRIEPSMESDSFTVNRLAIFDGDDDVTDEVLPEDGTGIVLVIPEPVRADISYSYTINEIEEYADSVGIPMIGLLGVGEDGVTRWRDVSMAEYPCYTADDTQLKELSRGLMSLVVLRDGVISSKTTVSSMNPSVLESPSSVDEFLAEIGGFGSGWFKWFNVLFGGVLLIIYMFQGLIIAIRLKIKGKYRRKQIKNS